MFYYNLENDGNCKFTNKVIGKAIKHLYYDMDLDQSLFIFNDDTFAILVEYDEEYNKVVFSDHLFLSEYNTIDYLSFDIISKEQVEKFNQEKINHKGKSKEEKIDEMKRELEHEGYTITKN